MALDSDLQSFKSEVWSDDSTNGGRLSDTLLVSGVAQNVWPNVMRDERLTGSTKYRKIFEKMNDDSNDPLAGAHLLMDLPTPGEDWVIMFIGTPTDTQADIVGTERKYGGAYLKNDITAGDSTFTVTVEDVSLTTGNDQLFFDTDSIRVTDKINPGSVAGNYEDRIINGTPSVSTLDITCTVSVPFGNSYLVADGARVGSLYVVPADVQARAVSLSVTSSAGTYDDTTYPVVVHNQATIDTTLTLLFTDATNFTVTSPQITGLPSGDRNTDYEPENAAWLNPYIVLDFQGFGGTFVAGDTIEIETSSSTKQRWEKRVVPPASGSLANNKVVSAWDGESV